MSIMIELLGTIIQLAYKRFVSFRKLEDERTTVTFHIRETDRFSTNIYLYMPEHHETGDFPKLIKRICL